MFIEIIMAITLGVAFGVFTGLIPGIHVNLISLLVLSFSLPFLHFIHPYCLAVFIIAMAITHTFIDSIPSIYLGAPDESMALSALPGHRLLLKGEGHNAVKLAVIGSILCLILALMLSPFLIHFFSISYPIIKNFIGWILIAMMCFVILRSKKRIPSLLFFLLSGVFGLITLNIPNIQNPLLPMLSGLFGLSILVISLKDNTKIPEQKDSYLNLETKPTIKAITSATGVAAIASFLPGFGSSQSAIVAKSIAGDIGDYGFLIMVGGINTVNMALSLITLYTIEKARNGAVVAVAQIVQNTSLTTLMIYFSSLMIAAGFAAVIAMRISKQFSRIIVKINYQKLIVAIIFFISFICAIFSGATGLVILATATSIGILASMKGVAKNFLMGCLIVPVIFFFL